MKRWLLLLAILVLPATTFAQGPATGFPPYGSFADGRFDAVNRQNLNVNFAIPVVSSPGRGTDFNFAVVHDSLVWKRVTVGANTSWQPVIDVSSNWGWKKDVLFGDISMKGQFKYCAIDGLDTTRLYNWAYIDPAGTRHAFNLDFHEDATECWYNTDPRTGYATDGSGYYLDATDPNTVIVWSPTGLKIIPDNHGSSLTDTNGNIINTAPQGWKDTLGRVTLKIIYVGSTIEYHVLDQNGAYQITRMNHTTYSIKTNFGCGGVNEYTNASVSLPTSLVLPNGQSYQFEYEDTPGFAGYKTVEIGRET